MQKVSIIGTGYVGLVSGVCLARLGHDVTCVDVDRDKVEKVNQGESPVYEEGLSDMLQQVLSAGRFRVTIDLPAAIQGTDTTLIAVGTPFDGQEIDLSFIRGSASQIGSALRTKTAYHVVAVKSTVVPGTTDDVVLPALEKLSGKKAGRDFGVGMNPEFLREGTAVADFMNPDRIVIGGSDERARKALAAVYAVFPGTEIVEVSNSTAEMIKYTSNALLATLISFSNEIANMCEDLPGVDVVDVMRGLHLDRRLTPRLDDGTTISPGILSYLMAGCGFGGSCLPKDVGALIAQARKHGYEPALLQAVIDINRRQPERLVTMLEKGIGSVRGKRIAILGLSFKPGTDDLRESPALRVIELLERRGAEVTVCDPLAAQYSRDKCPDFRFSDDIDVLAAESDALVLVTSWPLFRRVEAAMARLNQQPLVVDGRRFFDKRSFAHYDGIGLGEHPAVVAR